jgi:hypothetical protein
MSSIIPSLRRPLVSPATKMFIAVLKQDERGGSIKNPLFAASLTIVHRTHSIEVYELNNTAMI